MATYNNPSDVNPFLKGAQDPASVPSALMKPAGHTVPQPAPMAGPEGMPEEGNEWEQDVATGPSTPMPTPNPIPDQQAPPERPLSLVQGQNASAAEYGNPGLGGLPPSLMRKTRRGY